MVLLYVQAGDIRLVVNLWISAVSPFYATVFEAGNKLLSIMFTSADNHADI